MENIIAERVKTATLTKSQQKIAEFFIRNIGRVGSLSSLDAAREIGVSDASVIRFSRAIGFEGYADLKDNVYQMLAENAQGGLSLTERLTKNAERFGGAGDPAAFLALMESNIESAFRDNDPACFERIAEALVSAENRYIVGLRGCRGAAIQTARLLHYMLPRVHTVLDGNSETLHDFRDLTEKDAVLMLVFSRFYKIDLSFARLARERGARLFILTDTVAGPLTAYSEETVRIASDNMSFFHSTIGMDLAAEYILKLISDRVDCHKRIRQIDAITEPDRL